MAAAKRRRLQDLIGIGGVSDNALTDILGKLRQTPIEGPVCRQACNRAAQDSIRDSVESDDLPLVDGGSFSWKYLSPQRLLRKYIDRSPALASEFRQALRTHPNTCETPWSMILYFDEVTPGNVLRPDNKRKIMAVYMSFKELGVQRLCKTEFWFTIAVARTSVIHTVVGQWSRMLRVLLRAAFLGPQSFERAGVVLYVDGPQLFFARLSNILADEAALKQGLDCKGSSGLRPCSVCKNVMLKGSDIANRDETGYLVELTCSDLNRFDFASDQDLFDAADMLSEAVGRLGKRDFKNLQKSTGFNHNPHGVLADVELRAHSRPASSFSYDPMHVLYSNGVAAVEVHLLLQSMREKTRFDWRDLETFCRSDWHFPAFCKAKGRAIYQVFNETREKASKESFKCGATELLVVFPILLHFAELFLSGLLAQEMESFRALAEVVYEAQEAKFGRGDASKLATAVTLHLDLFKRTYGEDCMKPKHHMVCHLPKQLSRDGFLLDAFTVERKHQEVKRAASNTDNSREYEFSVLCRLHLDELRSQADVLPAAGLRGPQVRHEPVAATVADGLEFRGVRVSSGDIVFRHGAALMVCGAMQFDDGELAMLVRPMQLVRRLSLKSAIWRKLPMARCGVEGVRFAACWAVDGDEVTVLGG
jgi:hypothetical protein